MNNNLAIYSPYIGKTSETFINKHIKNLYPKNTVIITDGVETDGFEKWDISCPYLELNKIRNPLISSLFNRIYRKNTNDLIFRKYYLPIKEFIHENNVTTILGEYLDRSMLIFKISQKLNIPFYVHAHGYDVSICLNDEKWRTEYLNYNNAAAIIVPNIQIKNNLINIGIKDNLINIVPYGVDIPKQRIKDNNKKSVISCLAVGRMVTKKAPIFLLDSFRRASKIFPNITLDYIGEGSLYPAVSQYIQSFSLENKIKLHGAQPNYIVKDYMLKSDIFLQHSITDPYTGDQEGLPVAILEAMAHSIPVISTNHAGIPEAIINGVNGFLVDEGDVGNMSNKIIKLCKDEMLRKNFSEKALETAINKFSWDREREELINLIKLNNDKS